MDGECHTKLAQVAKSVLKKQAKYCNDCGFAFFLLCRKNRFFLPVYKVLFVYLMLMNLWQEDRWEGVSWNKEATENNSSTNLEIPNREEDNT